LIEDDTVRSWVPVQTKGCRGRLVRGDVDEARSSHGPVIVGGWIQIEGGVRSAENRLESSPTFLSRVPAAAYEIDRPCGKPKVAGPPRPKVAPTRYAMISCEPETFVGWMARHSRGLSP
jgi:hypothetical protein